MLSAENVAVLMDWTDEAKRLELALREVMEGRDDAIRLSLGLEGVGVGELVKLTGLTRARIYQISKPK